MSRTTKYKKPPVRTLDNLWSKLVKEKAHHICERCGKRESLNSHHVFGRRSYSVRWDIDNGVCLCASCHRFSSVFSAHETPTLFTEWVIKKRGRRWYTKLDKRHNEIYKGDRDNKLSELLAIEKQLRDRGWYGA